MWDHDGLCACGKRTYLFSRCPSCIEQEALDTAVEIAEREDAEVCGSSDRDPESPEIIYRYRSIGFPRGRCALYEDDCGALRWR